jgi:hypothetical protein
MPHGRTPARRAKTTNTTIIFSRVHVQKNRGWYRFCFADIIDLCCIRFASRRIWCIVVLQSVCFAGECIQALGNIFTNNPEEVSE